MNPLQRAASYAAAFPARPPLAAINAWVTGTWLIGACYRNLNRLYGAYPRGYLERVHAMFPDAVDVLHVFSGGLTWGSACEAAWPDLPPDGCAGCMELVDLHGPEQGRHPTWQGDVLALPADWEARFDLVLADPPYTAADAEKYGTPMPDRRRVTAALRRVTKKGGNLVWLDQVWPMHRKADWRCWGQIGLVRSTNHRVRLVSMFEAV